LPSAGNAASVSAIVQDDPHSIHGASLPDAPPADWVTENRGPIRWIFFARGALALVAGILLLAWPDRTLLLVGVVLGCFLVVAGVLETARAFSAPGRLVMERAIPATLGLIAVAVGTIVIARPESSVLAVAIAAGVYLIVAGLAAGVSAVGERGGRAPWIVLAVVDITAGAVVIAWPDVTVTVVAVVFGIALVLRGIAEIALGILIGRARR
jgi:uncharacterized membrane protein HdeD (DUF308 family)